MIKIGFIISNEMFRDEEYLEPKKVLDNAGITTITIAKQKTLCTGKLGATVNPDLSLENVNTLDFDGIVFIGGVGCKTYWHDETAHKICKEIIQQNKVLAAICSSVAILAFAGVLTGKKANSYPAERDTLKENGAILTLDDITIDGKIITATGPKVSRGFGEAILKNLR